jgi:Sulfotransferase family
MTNTPEASAAAKGAGRRIPDFFIVGHAKSGTTALYEMLRRHPQIYLPDVKEPWFFAPELRNPKRQRSLKHPDTLEDYLSLFTAAKPEQRIGEATPSYLWSRLAAGRISELEPQARIIAVLREPASFLTSLHLQFLQTDIETEKDLRRAIELEDARREGKAIPRNSARPRALLYSDHVRYVEQLLRYREAFSPEQMLVLIYEDFRADNQAIVREVLRFLDVDDRAPIETIEANPAVRVRVPQVQGLVRSLYLGRGPAARVAKAAIKAVTPRQLRRGALDLQRRAQLAEPRPPDPELMRELRRRFKGEVVALSEYMDRDLVDYWGYGDIE